MEPIGIQVGMGGGRGWVVAGDGWWQGMDGEGRGVLFIWANSREMSTGNVECVQTGSKC